MPPLSPPRPPVHAVLLERYLTCRTAVEDSGYRQDIDFYCTRSLDTIDQQEFLAEVGWVILNSGMRSTVCRRLWPRLRAVFLEFTDLPALHAQRHVIRAAALAILNYPAKIDAIFAAVDRVQRDTWPVMRAEIHRDGIDALRRLQYVGPVLVYHLGKNLGLPVAKPDRHLLRIAAAAGYGTNVQQLCQDLADASGDPIAAVDYVLWRTASSLMPDYISYFSIPQSPEAPAIPSDSQVPRCTDQIASSHPHDADATIDPNNRRSEDPP